MAFSPVATFGFVGTNYNKVANGDWTRYPVLSGQCINAAETTVKSVAKKSSVFSRVCDKAASRLNALAESNKVFNGVSKTVKFVKNSINPLIVASGVTKVLLAKKEDKEKTFYSEGSMIAGMFLGEGWMKKHLDKVVLSKLPVSKKWMPVVKGILFIAGSLLSSTIGQKLGQKYFSHIEKTRNERAALQREQLQSQLQEAGIVNQKDNVEKASRTNENHNSDINNPAPYKPLELRA